MKIKIVLLLALSAIGALIIACGMPAPASRKPAAPSSASSTTPGAPTPIQLDQGALVAVDRIGVKEIAPAKPLDQPNVARDPSIVPAPIQRTEPTTVKINLTVKEVNAELAPGATYSFWTFDGTVPGPMLRVMEGDTVEITLTNPATNANPHNIDLHAVNGPGGGAAVTNVAPGETKTFTFKALNPGAYVYHCAYAPPYHHIAQGMYGGIVVEPRGGLPKVDREFYVMQGEWYTTGKIGDKGHQEFSEEKAMAEQPEYFTMNGNTEALSKLFPLHVNVGETVRLFFGVGGPNVGSNFHIIGEIFDQVDSGYSKSPVQNEETWYVPPGSVSTFQFHVNEPGRYTLVDHALYRIAKGALGVMMADGKWDDTIYSPNAAESTH